MDLQTQLLKINGLDIFVASLGEGPAVLLLHGFPDSHTVWHHQMQALADAGFRAIAPDLRGYGRSSAPSATDDYRMAQLVADVLGLLDAMQIARADLVGHDWGAVLAWQVAILAPGRLHSLVALSVGHPHAFTRSGLPQALRSSYIGLFLVPGLAERVIRAFDWFLLRRTTGDKALQAQWTTSLAAPGRLTAALNYYRANARPNALARGRVQVPVLGMWSSGDRFLTERQMRLSGGQADDFTYLRIDAADHWLQWNASARVNTALLGFMRRV
jgi:pimeloyl-ACP methyl ester carboxylesterase